MHFVLVAATWYLETPGFLPCPSPYFSMFANNKKSDDVTVGGNFRGQMVVLTLESVDTDIKVIHDIIECCRDILSKSLWIQSCGNRQKKLNL